MWNDLTIPLRIFVRILVKISLINAFLLQPLCVAHCPGLGNRNDLATTVVEGDCLEFLLLVRLLQIERPIRLTDMVYRLVQIQIGLVIIPQRISPYFFKLGWRKEIHHPIDNHDLIPLVDHFLIDDQVTAIGRFDLQLQHRIHFNPG